MTTIKDLKSNYEVIRQVCEKYRKELTSYQGVIIDKYLGLDVDVNDYIKFMNTLPLDVFIGNLLVDLLISSNIERYKELMTDKITFKEFVEKSGIVTIDEIYELMERF
jgi:hypothetical protein